MSQGLRTPEQTAMGAEAMRWLQEQLEALPEVTRRMVLLRYAGELSVE